MDLLQRAVRAYYDSTSSFVHTRDVELSLRTAVDLIQNLNELMMGSTVDAQYKRVLANVARRKTIDGFKYLRNLIMHTPTPIKATPSAAFGGMATGVRTYFQWSKADPNAHAMLRPSTQKLGPTYDSDFDGGPVLESLLNALEVFASVDSKLVSRDKQGRWLEFPLRHQAGINSRIHPEEPKGRSAALAWLHDHAPGGDFRVVLSTFNSGGIEMVGGLTFIGSWSFQSFVEDRDQIDTDIRGGYPYFLAPDVNFVATSLQKWPGNDRGGASFAGFRLASPPDPVLACSSLTGQTIASHSFQNIDFQREAGMHGPSASSYTDRRSARMAAWYPVS